MIFTFYSYKGGVGRSMALANVAELLYRAGLKVLMVDWDLEAPGLERFFFTGKEMDNLLTKPGLMDLLLDYKDRLSTGWDLTKDEKLPSPFAQLDDFIHLIDQDPASKGQLHILTAGKRLKKHFPQYARHILNFDWQDFYQTWEGERYIEWLRQQLNQRADVVLVDSRTGVTEIGGICTYHLADTIIMFCAPNQQNLDGIYDMAHNFTSPSVQQARPNRPLNILIIPARVERAESNAVDLFQNDFITEFAKFKLEENSTNLEHRWDLRIPYIPKYAFTESIAVRDAWRESAKDMSLAFIKLTNWLWDKLKENLPQNTFDKKRLKFIENNLDEKKLLTNPHDLSYLTPQQRRVLVYVAQGSTNQDIADEIGISIKMVEKHLRNMNKKLGVSNRVQAARIAIEAGLLDS